jgi:hypothetical protein
VVGVLTLKTLLGDRRTCVSVFCAFREKCDGARAIAETNITVFQSDFVGDQTTVTCTTALENKARESQQTAFVRFDLTGNAGYNR